MSDVIVCQDCPTIVTRRPKGRPPLRCWACASRHKALRDRTRRRRKAMEATLKALPPDPGKPECCQAWPGAEECPQHSQQAAYDAAHPRDTGVDGLFEILLPGGGWDVIRAPKMRLLTSEGSTEAWTP